jgi:RNA polymerase sigma factor (sigma-70 family)
MDPYRVKVTVRNNLLLNAIEGAGFRYASEFARSIGLRDTDISMLVAMRDSPIKQNGEFSDAAKAIMEALGAAPTDLWTTAQLTMRLRKNSAERSVSEAGFLALAHEHGEAMTLPDPEAAAMDVQRVDVVSSALDAVTPKSAEVLRKRYGLDGRGEMTLQEIGDELGYSREHVRQLETKGLRQLRMKSYLGHNDLADVSDCPDAYQGEYAQRVRRALAAQAPR